MVVQFQDLEKINKYEISLSVTLNLTDDFKSLLRLGLNPLAIYIRLIFKDFRILKLEVTLRTTRKVSCRHFQKSLVGEVHFLKLIPSSRLDNQMCNLAVLISNIQMTRYLYCFLL